MELVTFSSGIPVGKREREGGKGWTRGRRERGR